MTNPPAGGVQVMFTPQKPPRPVRTGGPTVFVATPKAFHVKFQYKNPLTNSLQPLPKGLIAFMYKGAELQGDVKGVELDAAGYAALKTESGAKGDYHFVIRHDVRKFLDLDKGKLAPAEKIEAEDKRNLLEIPMELDTAKGHFAHGTVDKLTLGSFKAYDGSGEGKAGSPIVFTLNLAWYPLQFKFYNAAGHAFANVPRGLSLAARVDGKSYAETLSGLPDIKTLAGGQKHLILMGFDCGATDGKASDKTTKAVKAFQTAHGLKGTGTYDADTTAALRKAFYTPRTAVFKDDVYLLPLLKPSAPSPKIDFAITQTDMYLGVSASKPPVFKKLKKTEFDALDTAAQLALYDLPDSWISTGAKARIDGKLDAPKTQAETFQALQCFPVGAKELEASKPIVYVLDDMILMKDKAQLETWIASTRYALFDEDAKIVDPDPDAPFLTKEATRADNYFIPGDKKVFAVFAAGKYYFARRRVPAGTVGAGLRAAVHNDVVQQKVQQPMVDYIGNYQQFFCHGVKMGSKGPVSYLLLSWQCYLKVHAAVTTPVDQAKVQTGIINYTKEGMTNCKARHEKQGFEGGDAAGKSKLSLQLVKHFVAGPQATAFCEVSVHAGSGAARDNMGMTNASFNVANYKEQSVDGWFTAAHELGHAMGVADDYLEPPAAWGNEGWRSPVFPRFAQWVKGGPYAEDVSCLMKANETMRHRLAFHHVDWANTDPTIRRLTGNLRFHLKNKAHTYFVPPADERGFASGSAKFMHYAPAFSENNFTTGTGKMDLLLYKAGQDETQKVITPSLKFDAVLVACLYIKWSFINGAGTWDQDTKTGQVKAVYQQMASAVHKKYYLKASSSTHFQKVLVLFRFHFHEGPDSNDNRVIVPYNPATYIPAQFTLNCHWDATDPSYKDPAFTGSTLDTHTSTNEIALLRYLIGKKPMKGTGATATEITKIESADLGFLATWVEGKLAGTKLGKGYTVQSI